MRRTLVAVAVSLLATAALLGGSPAATADTGGSGVVQLAHPPKCC